MNKHAFLFLFLLVIGGLSVSAMAEEFPADGLMLANKTYTGAAIEGILPSVEDGATVNTVAEYKPVCALGYYLPHGSSAECTLCPVGNYCPGGTYEYNENIDQGMEYCSELGSREFTLSEEGSSSATDCYRECAVTDKNKAVTVTGRVYYCSGGSYCGTYASTCSAAQCVKGYHTEGNVISGIDWPDYIGDNRALGLYIDNNGVFGYINEIDMNSLRSQEGFASVPNTFEIRPNGSNITAYGQAKCTDFSDANTSSGQSPYGPESINGVSTFIDLGNSAGGNCYCRLTGVKDADDGYAGQLRHVSARWVKATSFNDVTSCQSGCARACASVAVFGSSNQSDSGFLSALKGSLLALDSCQANTITINWYRDEAGTDLINSTQVQYDGNIITPTDAPQLTGKKFKGWTFKK